MSEYTTKLESSVSFSVFIILSVVISVAYVLILGFITFVSLKKNGSMSKIIDLYFPKSWAPVLPEERSQSRNFDQERHSVYERRRANMEKDRMNLV